MKTDFGFFSRAKEAVALIKKIGPFAPYIFVALLAVWGAAGPQRPVYSFFQSPVQESLQTSPVATPTAPPLPTNTPFTLPPTTTPTAIPPTAELQPPSPPPIEATPTVLTSTVELTPTRPLTATLPTLPLPEPPRPTPPPAPTPAPAPTLAPAPPGEVVINEVKLIDTIVKWLAWGWMCLGVGLILLALIIFPLLQVRGTHLRRSGG